MSPRLLCPDVVHLLTGSPSLAHPRCGVLRFTRGSWDMRQVTCSVCLHPLSGLPQDYRAFLWGTPEEEPCNVLAGLS
jgi:hypothetical protein